MSGCYVVGLDVGSAEVRCGLVESNGRLVKTATFPLEIYNERPGYYQQSSRQIWQAVVNVIKKVTKGIDVEQIRGIGCDATCSLVVVGADTETVSVSPGGKREDDVMMWMDHRAGEQAETVNKTGHELLSYLGGKVSLEMQLPKLMWLKQNLPQVFHKARHFFDLPDFLTWKLTGSLTRSRCSLVCKWMYQGSPNSRYPGWNTTFLTDLGLQRLCENNFHKIGEKVAMPGEAVGLLTDRAAQELGLKTGIPVAASLIDAHAGTLALLATEAPLPYTAPLTNRLGMICGTSSCIMLLSEKEAVVEGVWGPYFGVVLDKMWLSEGGQSSAGQLVDHLVATHPYKIKPSTPDHVCKAVIETLEKMALVKKCDPQLLSKDVHVYPDFRGNRSPLADPSLRGMISGLDLNTDEEQFAVLYLATLQALSYSARQTTEKLESRGLGPIRCLVLCGGLSRNALYLRTLTGAVARDVLVPRTDQSVLLGSAMLAATAAGLFPSLSDSMRAMAPSGDLHPVPHQEILRYHEKKYQVYLKMQMDQLAYKNIMSE